ncbi:MAG: Gfo/Idh/MocA family oxidoreductase [Propionibacteriaceae bacterium]|nr:Gfo/Idh/MocA family oxidoreductase [Propionibacteriaceae bacterium]
MRHSHDAGPLRILIAGAGRFGTLHARVWKENGSVVVGVVDIAADRAAGLAGRIGAAHHGTDLAEVIALAQPDVVVITSDEATHAALAQTALRANCHVFVEKPFALTSADATATVALAEEHGLIAFAGHVSRFAQPYQRIAESLRAGRLGRLWTVRLRRDFSRAWFDDFGDRVHPVWESGIHDIDLAIFFAGVRPVRACALQSTAAGDAAASVFQILVDFADGSTATIESAWSIPPRGPQSLVGALELDGTIAAECEVHGSAGVAKQRLVSDALVEWTDAGVNAPDLSLWPLDGTRVGGALRTEIQAATAAFRGDVEPAIPHAEAVWTVETAEAACASLETGRFEPIGTASAGR